MAFNPRDIPMRAHYDRLQTWITGIISRRGGDFLSDLQALTLENGKEAAKGDDDDAKVLAVLAELGFCAVVDAMADRIETNEQKGGG